jgi:hypothetical protein
MNTKTGKKTAGKKEKTVYNQCINCRRPCSMSGLCMRMWPEFVTKETKGGSHGHKNGKKSS